MEPCDLRQIALALVILRNFLLPNFGDARNTRNYYGAPIGNLRAFDPGIKGQVYAIDDTTIFIKGFSYVGTGTESYFWIGDTSMPHPGGDIVPYPEDYIGRDPPFLETYNNTNIILKLPREKRIRDIKWLSIWCPRFTLKFAEVHIPMDLEVPKVRVLPQFSRLAHGLSSGNISILDLKTIYIPNLHYDGAGPDAYFLVGNGSEPNGHGVKVPNEAGSLTKLRDYQGEDIEIVLPGNITVYDIKWLAVWCFQYKTSFGYVLIPEHLNVPPALGQTKITTMSPPVLPPPSITNLRFTNCKEMLKGRVEVQWRIVGDDVQIRLSGRVKDDHWVAFGLSGREGEARMLEGDVVIVAYIAEADKFIAEDYYISDLSPCNGQRGVCPDERIGGQNDVILLHGQRKHGVTSVVYQRPMRTNEPVLDRMIPETETSVIAATGPLNALGEPNSHAAFDKTSDDVRIDFTSTNVRECTNSLYDAQEKSDEIAAWPATSIIDESNFNVRIGPAGGDRGYSRITGQPSRGIAWYVNDLLIPELIVERGQTYTFVIEGGNDLSNPDRYHPFYITTSPEGGYGQKTENQQMEQKVFAGVGFDKEGYPYPTAAGRYCEWVSKNDEISDDFATFEAFFETLRLECDQGEPAKLVWTVEQDTPDLVYYQCYAHNHFGWKINVVDAGYRLRRKESNGTRAFVLPSLVTILTILCLRLTFLR